MGLNRAVSEVKKAFEEDLADIDDNSEADESLGVASDEVVMSIDSKQARRIRKMI